MEQILGDRMHFSKVHSAAGERVPNLPMSNFSLFLYVPQTLQVDSTGCREVVAGEVD